MFKKILLIFALLAVAQSAFAIDKQELNPGFFERFNDNCLNYYINSAIENNHSAKEAAARVEQYRQQAKYSLGNELPSFSVSANYLGIKVPQLDNFQLKKNAFILPFMMNYEADFLLKNRDKTRSAKKSYEASKFEEKAVYLSLLSDVASVYTDLLEYDQLITIQKENVDIYTKLLEYESRKFARGVINSTQLNNAAKQLENAKNSLEKLQKEQEVLLMQLAVLTGVSPENAKNFERGNFSSFEYSGTIPEEIQSDVIFARPDVMAAETKLEKAKIDIRVARKEFLPNFNITGLWVFNTIAPGTFFSWESSLAAILAGATQDIFAGGKKVANLRYQKAKYEELFENYKQVDLEAVKEVNTSLCFIKHDSAIEKNTLKTLAYEYNNLSNSKKKLARGTISNPEYLMNLSEFLKIQNDAVQAKNQRLVNYFTLYKAVGGKL